MKPEELKFELRLANQKIQDLEKENERMMKLLDKYVTLSRFLPVEKVVFGLAGTILLFVLQDVLSK